MVLGLRASIRREISLRCSFWDASQTLLSSGLSILYIVKKLRTLYQTSWFLPNRDCPLACSLLAKTHKSRFLNKPKNNKEIDFLKVTHGIWAIGKNVIVAAVFFSRPNKVAFTCSVLNFVKGGIHVWTWVPSTSTVPNKCICIVVTALMQKETLLTWLWSQNHFRHACWWDE